MARSKSTSFSALTAVLGSAAFVAGQPSPSTENWTATHDPAIIKQGDTYYLFSTGRGLPMHTSKDLIHWTRVGEAFEKMPAWAAEPFPKTRDMWAPDIVLVDGTYRLYYTVSEFGTSHSAIGLATNSTLDRNDPAYRWADQGIILSTEKTSNWNAIDSAAFVDQGGQHWMAIGSYWSGLKLFKLDGATGKVIAGDKPRPIAARPDSGGAVEASFVTWHDDFYYLWSSFDACCQGSNSTYNTRVGRSKSPEGPYVDRDGKPLLEGGGTLVIRGYENVRGPGHNAVLHDGDTDYLVHHWYDASHRGRQSLAVRPIVWDAEGWPLPGEPLAESKEKYESPAGKWLISSDFSDGRPVVFTADANGTNGKIDGDRGLWASDGKVMTLRFTDRRAPGGEWIDEVTLSADKSWFVGRDQKGQIVRGRRDVP